MATGTSVATKRSRNYRAKLVTPMQSIQDCPVTDIAAGEHRFVEHPAVFAACSPAADDVEMDESLWFAFTTWN